MLAHDKCNNAKSDFLAAERHLEAWLDRTQKHMDELQERLVASALPCDLSATIQVVKWMYQQTENQMAKCGSWRRC